MSRRLAMTKRVRGQKWPVIITRMLASEKEICRGCALRSSSTITTGGSAADTPPAGRGGNARHICRANDAEPSTAITPTFPQQDGGEVAVGPPVGCHAIVLQVAPPTGRAGSPAVPLRDPKDPAVEPKRCGSQPG